MRKIEIYTPDRLATAQASMKESAMGVAAAAALGILLCIAGIGMRWQWLCVGGLIVGCWAAYYLLDTQLRPLAAETAFTRHMLGVQPGKMTVQWGGIAPESVYVEGVRAAEIRCAKDGAAKTFYLRAEEAPPEIPTGETVQIESVDRFIVRITWIEG